MIESIEDEKYQNENLNDILSQYVVHMSNNTNNSSGSSLLDFQSSISNISLPKPNQLIRYVKEYIKPPTISSNKVENR